MPCETATVPAPSLEDGQVNTGEIVTSTNSGKLLYTVSNTNGVEAVITVEHVVNGNRVGTKTYTVPPGDLVEANFQASFDLNSDTSVTMCANHTSTERA